MSIRRYLSHPAAALIFGSTILASCSLPTSDALDSDRLKVVVSTEILADLVRQVGGDRITVETVIPAGGDPHSFEPSPADAKLVATADLGFTNHLLLEEHALIKMFDSNIPDGSPNVSLAERAEQYGATLIPLVEDVELDTIWLGFAVKGKTSSRSDEIEVRATKITGPGDLSVYLTQTLGEPEKYFSSADGVDANDLISLPPDAHTHVNWAFSKPGEYQLDLESVVKSQGTSTPVAKSSVTFAVGVDPKPIAQRRSAQILDQGHTDIAVDLTTTKIMAKTDLQDIPAEDVVIEVPDRAQETIPQDDRFSFIGPAGNRVWQLPQAVLGKHVHGEIDPHLWHDARNAKAYVQAISAALISVDPAGKSEYQESATTYSRTLDDLHRSIGETLAVIPAEKRQLITTHDAFGYLAKAYNFTIAGFVVPNPAQEPSAAQVRELSNTIRRLKVPAVFIEPNLHQRAAVLSRVAADAGVSVCEIHGDTFSPKAKTYVELMNWNAQELRRCLTKER